MASRSFIVFDRETFALVRDACAAVRADRHCIRVVRDKDTLAPRRCRNRAVRDCLCEKHHPNAIRRRMSRK